MRIRFVAALLCLFLALGLVGCVHADRTVALNADGSGVYTFTVGLSDQLVRLGGTALTKNMEDFGARVERDGGTYSHYEENGYSTWKYVRPFTSVRQLDDFLQQSPQTGSNTNSSANADTQNTVHVAADAGFFSTTYHVTGHIGLVFPDVSQAARDLLKDARFSFAVTMPGWVSQQYGGTLNGNTVTYVVHYGESTTINVTGGGANIGHIALVAGGILLLALLIAGLVLLRRGKLRLSKPAPAIPPMTTTSPYYMPTQPGQPGGETTFPATPEYP